MKSRLNAGTAAGAATDEDDADEREPRQRLRRRQTAEGRRDERERKLDAQRIREAKRRARNTQGGVRLDRETELLDARADFARRATDRKMRDARRKSERMRPDARPGEVQPARDPATDVSRAERNARRAVRRQERREQRPERDVLRQEREAQRAIERQERREDEQQPGDVAIPTGARRAAKMQARGIEAAGTTNLEVRPGKARAAERQQQVGRGEPTPRDPSRAEIVADAISVQEPAKPDPIQFRDDAPQEPQVRGPRTRSTTVRELGDSDATGSVETAPVQPARDLGDTPVENPFSGNRLETDFKNYRQGVQDFTAVGGEVLVAAVDAPRGVLEDVTGLDQAGEIAQARDPDAPEQPAEQSAEEFVSNVAAGLLTAPVEVAANTKEGVETAAYVAEPATRGDLKEVSERGDEAGAQLRSLVMRTQRSAVRNPEAFAGASLGEAALGTAGTSVIRRGGGRVPTSRVDTRARSAATDVAGSVGRRTPDVELTRDPDAGLVRVDPALRARGVQKARQIRNRIQRPSSPDVNVRETVRTKAQQASLEADALRARIRNRDFEVNVRDRAQNVAERARRTPQQVRDVGTRTIDRAKFRAQDARLATEFRARQAVGRARDAPSDIAEGVDRRLTKIGDRVTRTRDRIEMTRRERAADRRFVISESVGRARATPQLVSDRLTQGIDRVQFRAQEARIGGEVAARRRLAQIKDIPRRVRDVDLSRPTIGRPSVADLRPDFDRLRPNVPSRPAIRERLSAVDRPTPISDARQFANEVTVDIRAPRPVALRADDFAVESPGVGFDPTDEGATITIDVDEGSVTRSRDVSVDARDIGQQAVLRAETDRVGRAPEVGEMTRPRPGMLDRPTVEGLAAGTVGTIDPASVQSPTVAPPTTNLPEFDAVSVDRPVVESPTVGVGPGREVDIDLRIGRQVDPRRDTDTRLDQPVDLDRRRDTDTRLGRPVDVTRRGDVRQPRIFEPRGDKKRARPPDFGPDFDDADFGDDTAQDRNKFETTFQNPVAEDPDARMDKILEGLDDIF